MSATLNVVNNFELTSQGISMSGKQGEATDDFSTAHEITVTGKRHQVTSSLATATVVTVWDDDDDTPADWDYLFFWADVDMYIQVIGSGTSIIFKVLAFVPFTLTYDSMLGAASTTAITGGSEPTLTDIDSIVVGNYSGDTGNYVFAVID